MMVNCPQETERPAAGIQLAPFNPVPWYTPRIWHGMNVATWQRLVAEYGYRISPSRWDIAAITSAITALPTVSNRLQRALFAKRAAALPLVQDPIFIIGHWRTGTTYLQELMMLDERWSSPTTFQCFSPLSFLVSRWWIKPLTSLLLPKRRPMDNMDMSWDAPQEDEIALMTMGLPTTYRRIAFPNEPARHLNYLDMACLSPSELSRWKAGLQRFVNYLNYFYRRPLVLKSPPHTGRMKILLEMFPQAKFIHLTRDPLKFIPSTIHMWAALDHSNALQVPTHQSLRDFVFTCFDRLYQGFNRDQGLLDAGHFINIRFEDLLADTESVMQHIYDQLDLGDFAQVGEAIRARLERDRQYRPNEHVLTEDLVSEIEARCSQYCEQFGYAGESAAA